MSNQLTYPINNSDIKMLIVDIDGTIAGASNTSTLAVRAAIKAVIDKGIKVGIATGRMYRSALRFYHEIGATLPIICYQGALIKDPTTDQIIRNWTIKPDILARLLDYFDHSPLRSHFSLHLYIDDQLYVEEILPETVAYISRSSIPAIPVGNFSTLLDQPITKLLAYCENPSINDQLLAQTKQIFSPEELYLIKSNDIFCEATNPLANKGAGVRYLAEEVLGLTATEVMTIGDHFNDAEMIAYAGIGVAMGNAPDPIKAIATWVAPSIEQDGVVAAIEKFILSDHLHTKTLP